MDYYYYRKHVNPYYNYYGYYPYRYYPYGYYPYRYYGVYDSNISNIDQNIINSGSMSDVYQNAYVNQTTRR